MSIKALSRLKTPEEFDEIIIKTDQAGNLIKIKDVGRVELGAENYSDFLSFSGEENIVGMLINQLPGSNALDVNKRVRAEIEHLAKSFPEDLKYVIPFSPTEFVKESINEVVKTLIESILLVILVIFIFLQRWRSTLIPAITIPVSLIGTFIFMKLVGVSINTLTLFGLTLATGLVVDDAIVVLENISRFIEEKKMPSLQAASEGMKEIFSAVLATSIVLISVFIPACFFPGSTGELYRQLSLAITFSIIISTFNAVTLSPALSALFLRSNLKAKEGKFYDIINNSIKSLKNKVKSILVFCFRKQVWILSFYIFCLASIFIVYKLLPSSFVPEEDRSYFVISVQAPEGTSIENTKKIVDQVQYVLGKEKDLQGVFAIVGFSFFGSGPNKAILFPTLKEFKHRKKVSQSAKAVLARLRPQLMGIPGAYVIPFNPPAIEGLGNFGGFQYELKADGTVSLQDLAKYAYMLMGASTEDPRLAGVFTSFTASDPQIQIEIDRDKAKSLGVDLREILATLQVYMASDYVNDFDLRNKIYRVYAQADKQFRSNPKDIDNLYVKSQTGEMIPMSNLIIKKETVSPQVISHFNLERSAEISGSAGLGFSSGQAIKAMEELSAKLLPKGFTFEWAGISREELETGNKVFLLFMLGIFFTFLVLAAQYESFIDPFIILLSVPLAMFTGFTGQLLAGLQNDVYCQMGLLLLIGVASKNAILIVEYANQLRKNHNSLLRSIIKATLTRFRPILMTSFAFMLGLLPLVFAQGAGSESRHSLGVPVLCGMFFSTFLNLFILPIFYYIIVSMKEKKFSA